MAQRYDDQDPRRYSGGDWAHREWRDRERQRDPTDFSGPQPYGQREPYNLRDPYDSREPYSSDPSDRGHDRWSATPDAGYRRGQSRYSESQYGQRGRPWSDPRRSSSDFDARPFGDTSESPRFFGTGNYAEGGAHYTGGYDQRGDQSGYSRGDYDYDRHAGQQPRRGPLQRTFKRGPKGYQRSDDRLREDISERLMMAENVDSSDVTVTVVAGKVTLEGTVPDRYTKHYIEDLTDECPGVQDIDNRIRVGSASRQTQSQTQPSVTKR